MLNQSTLPFLSSQSMARSEQCFRACAFLSARLTAHGIPHAFSGGFLTVALGSPRETEVRLQPIFSLLSLSTGAYPLQEIFCVAPGFKSVRHACANSDVLSTQLAPWSSRWVLLMGSNGISRLTFFHPSVLRQPLRYLQRMYSSRSSEQCRSSRRSST